MLRATIWRIRACSPRHFTRSSPDAALSVLVLDDVDSLVDDTAEPFDVVRPGDLDIEPREFHHMATIYDILELSTAVKPWLLQHLLETDELVCFLDPDIEVFGSLAPLELLARRHSIVLTPHTTTPMPRDGLLPSEKTIRLAGVFNLGFIALSREAGPFLSWWADRLRRECRIAFEDGLFVDQRWIDFVPSYFDHAIVSDPGYNVAYWNLYEREVKLGADGYEVNGRPLRFFHFSGFNPLRPHVLSKFQAGELRIRLQDEFTVAQLCSRYASRLLAAGYLDESSIAYRYGYTAAGVPIDGRARRVYANELAAAEAKESKPGPSGSVRPRGGRRVRELARLAEPGRLRDPCSPATSAGSTTNGPTSRPASTTSRPRAGPTSSRGYAITVAPTPASRRSTCRHPVRSVPADPAAFPIGVNLVGCLRAEDGTGGAARGAARGVATRRSRR